MPPAPVPPPKMNRKEQAAYDEALRMIKACRKKGGRGTSLDLDGIGLETLPPEIGQLSALTVLSLNNNQLTTLPPEIGQLSALTTLSLSNNQLTTLPPEIGQLSALTALYLPNNQLTTLPPEIGQLSALTALYLSNNKLTTLPPEIGQLSALTELYLSNNKLTTLPPEIGQLSALRKLYLHNNPGLGLPPEVQGPTFEKVLLDQFPPANPRDILDYYFSTRGAEGRALREVKVIIVGRGEVGKSTLVEMLKGGEFIKDRPRTDGVAITPWDVTLPDGDAVLHMWDFGGQEIMHGTHQFFLTHRSLYVVMVDGRHDRGRQDAEYWLRLVRAFGGESPVLVVMNRQKAHPFVLDQQHLADKYSINLDHFFRTDCEDKTSISRLRQVIEGEAERMLAQEERFPVRCWDLKEHLAAMKQRGENYLSQDEYEALCVDHGMTEREVQQKLLRRLADLGTVVSFPDDVKLSALSVLSPEWATDGIYRIITNEALREKKHGLLSPTYLRELLPAPLWPKDLHRQYVLDLMGKFELCFPVDGADDGAVLVPELLADQTPALADWEAAQCLVFQYRYPVLPHGVLPRFITRTHTLSNGRLRWRTGVVLGHDGAEALIKADYEACEVTLWLRGEHLDARRALLAIARQHFHDIHSRIKDLNPAEHVAVPGHPEVLVPYNDVLADERRGKTEFAVTLHPGTVRQERVDWPISELLNGVESAASRRATHRRSPGPQGGGGNHYYAPVTHHNTHIGRDNYGIAGGSGNRQTIDDSFNPTHDSHACITNSQVGQTLKDCALQIQQQSQGVGRDLLESLRKDVETLIARLPDEDRQQEAADNFKLLVQQAGSDKPKRAWFDTAAAELQAAAQEVKDFPHHIAKTVGALTQLLWP